MQFPDWCRRQPRVSRLGPADQAARLSETPVAFAGAGRASTETVIAFTGEKWAFLERFSVAVVLLVSTVAFQGRAVVMGVSCWPASVLRRCHWLHRRRGRGPVREKVRPARPDVCVSAKYFAQRAHNGPQSASCGVLE